MAPECTSPDSPESLSMFSITSRRWASMNCSLARVTKPSDLTETFPALTLTVLHSGCFSVPGMLGWLVT